MKNNDAETMAKYLHLDVDVVSPMRELRGRGRVQEGAKGLMPHVMDLEIRARLASDEQVMLVYDIDCSERI